MIRFSATIQKFGQQGEKTGWTYIAITPEQAEKLMPGTKKVFRVKGRIDSYAFALVGLVPIGGGQFILVLNATMRKAIQKQKGAVVKVVMEVDHEEPQPPPELMECLQDEPESLARFEAQRKIRRNHFSHGFKSAKSKH